MSAGEFIATKSQNEVLKGEIGLERVHIRDEIAEEMKEVDVLLETIGIPQEQQELRQELFHHYESNPDSLLKFMAALEFGVVEKEERSPFFAAFASGFLFFLGSLPSVLPFAFGSASSSRLLMIACIATVACLLIVGAVKTWATRGNLLTAALENLVIAGVGGILAYYVGALFDHIVH